MKNCFLHLAFFLAYLFQGGQAVFRVYHDLYLVCHQVYLMASFQACLHRHLKASCQYLFLSVFEESMEDFCPDFS
ncbi:UNVERIFIED_CONTAM: hypothetical protein NCL1_12873 [Trichonephila clavipes]